MMKFPSSSALLIIDMLNDFVDEKGSLYVPTGANIVGAIKEKKAAFKKDKLLVVYVNDCHDENDEEFNIWPRHAVSGTWGAEVHPGISPEGGDYIVEKKKYSGFFGTSLHKLLREKGVEHIYLSGLLTDVCVFFTAHDGYNLGYKVHVFSDATTSLDDETHKAFLDRMKKLFGAEVL